MSETTTYEVVIDNSLDKEQVEEALRQAFPTHVITVHQVEKVLVDPLEDAIKARIRNELLFGP